MKPTTMSYREQLSRSPFRLRGMGELLAGGGTHNGMQEKGSFGSHRTTYGMLRGGAEVIWRGISVGKIEGQEGASHMLIVVAATTVSL